MPVEQESENFFKSDVAYDWAVITEQIRFLPSKRSSAD